MRLFKFWKSQKAAQKAKIMIMKNVKEIFQNLESQFPAAVSTKICSFIAGLIKTLNAAKMEEFYQLKNVMQ